MENLDNHIEKKIREILVNGKLPCASALKLAKDLGVSPRRIGNAADRLKIKIAYCQLGCFE